MGTLRIACGSVAIAVALAIGNSARPGIPHYLFIRGDANYDRVIDLADVLTQIYWLYFGQSHDCLDAMDVDDNGTLNAADVMHLLSWLFLGTKPPPAPPFPDCGEDTTPGGLGGCRANPCGVVERRP